MSRWIVLALVAGIGGCKKTPVPTPTDAEAAAPAVDATVLTREWTGPYGGVPPLDQVEIAMFEPAMLAAMEAHTAEITAIAEATGPATVENTLVPLERAGSALGRALTLYGVWNSTMSSAEVRAIQAKMSPLLSAHFNSIRQDAALYARVKALAETDLTGPEKRIVDALLHDFELAGVNLDPEPRARVAAIDQELSSLYNQFGNNLLADEEGYRTRLGPDDIAGLPQSWLDGAADPEQADTWWVRNTRSSVDPFLTFSANRPLREKVWRTFYDRGDNGGESDNNAIVASILKLRQEKAKLLGYDSYAHMRLADKMAKTPDAAVALLERVWTPSVAKFEEEVAAMQSLADDAGEDITIEAWDVKYYGEKLRARDYDLEAKELTPYLQLEKLREAMFWAAGELYGYGFEPVDDVPVQHPDVRVWKVLNADGSTRGLWYFDPYAREGKRSGAWMNAYRVQNHLDGELPIVTNQSNFVKGTGDKPVTISWDDASTLFHEFGHALHGLASDVHYPSLAGTNTLRDFVEFPSQLNEAWLGTPRLLERFALHVDTGEPMPAELIERVKRAANAGTGFRTTELLASALVDMKLHTADATDLDPDAFEKAAMAELGTPDEIVMRHRIPQFGHVFSGEGYAAGYYSYVWADVLTADAAEAFEEAGSYYDETVASSYLENVLSVGNTVDPAEAFRTFRGRDPDVGALLRSRGFPDGSE
jgi:peptidyl-dipeptidase Dcp